VRRFRQRLLAAIGRPHPQPLKKPSATEPRYGSMTYGIRLLFGGKGDDRSERL
jgi:hypothetical protein